jgi:single-strand DNA-binding protein
MSSFSSVTALGRLSRDPEYKNFGSGLATFTVVVNDRKKNKDSGQWEDSPVYIDCKAFNAENGRKLASTINDYGRKGVLVLVSGKITQESWDDKATGAKRSKLVVIVSEFQLCEKKQDGQQSSQGGQQRGRQESALQQYDEPQDDNGIPF